MQRQLYDIRDGIALRLTGAGISAVKLCPQPYFRNVSAARQPAGRYKLKETP
jgi:hypothetical protein